MKYTRFFQALLLLVCLFLTAPLCAFGQDERQKQLMVRGIIEQGNAFMKKQAFKEALAEYEKCLDIDPGNVTAKSNIVLLHDNLGVYYFKQNQYQDAQVEWETALQLNPNDSKAKRNMLVLKNTLAHLGLDLNTEREMIKQEKKVEQDNEQDKKKVETPSAVLILKGNKPNVQDKDYVNQYYSHEPAGTIHTNDDQVEIKNSGQEQKTVNTLIDSTNQNQLIEKQLSRIERKVYGRPLDELPVIKRLEKLEGDNFGQVSTSPILQRVQKLNELYPN